MKELVAHMASENEIRWEKEIEILKDEGVPQTAMKEKEKQLRKLAEDGKRRMEEGLRRMQGNMNQLDKENEIL